MRTVGLVGVATVLLLTGCGARHAAPAAPAEAGASAGSDCATAFVAALVASDASSMYDCSTGEFQHRIDERADMAGRTPAAELDRELRTAGYTATRYSLQGKAPLRATAYRVANLSQVAIFELETDHGRMRLQVYLDPAGKVAQVSAPQPDPRDA